jgi:hypothetical protein
MLRAMAVRAGATESSKSKIKASAAVMVDLASFFSLSPGTKSKRAQGHHYLVPKILSPASPRPGNR